MDIYHLLFNAVSFIPGPLWMALWLVPQSRLLHRIIDAIIILFCAGYTLLVLPDLPQILPLIAKPTPEALAAVFGTVPAVSLAWTHFVIGDLWVGRWIAVDSSKEGFAKWARLPILLLTLFFGPMGFLFYILVRSIVRKKNPLMFSDSTKLS